MYDAPKMGGIACPKCGNIDTDVKDSRQTASGLRRRRRACECGEKFTTYESREKPSTFDDMSNADQTAIREAIRVLRDFMVR